MTSVRRLTAAAVVAAGLVAAGAATASAAPASAAPVHAAKPATARISSMAEFQAHLAKAVTLEAPHARTAIIHPMRGNFPTVAEARTPADIAC